MKTRNIRLSVYNDLQYQTKKRARNSFSKSSCFPQMKIQLKGQILQDFMKIVDESLAVWTVTWNSSTPWRVRIDVQWAPDDHVTISGLNSWRHTESKFSYQTLQKYGTLKWQWIRTDGQENTKTSVGDMVLFTSHKETGLQCVYNKCSKWPALGWIQSLGPCLQ